ncbi:DUF368 domain-containing protein [Natrononativus amylolyticus]|uniref:DUF368 domain-containing protein n=1 Tax=Natrononativus amylolyticus TaxID=2963434 RepID=UPI0020CB84AD|nr:DUF368 domain-containing protein [Natrononativus amylolyticus]
MGYNVHERVLDHLELFRVYVYGLCMGTADALPGVSGGTVALLLGFYGRLLAAITAITPGRITDVCRGYDPARRGRAREALTEIDLQFLLPLGVGMVTAVAIIAELVTMLAESNPVALSGFFTGLIAASAIVLYRGLSVTSLLEGVAVVAGVGFALLVGSGVLEIPGSGPVVIFVAGIFAISAMILPGISGALILVLLGQYVVLSGELSALTSAAAGLVSGGSLAALVDPGTSVLLFVTGGLVGLLTIARVVRRALEWNRELTLLFLVSLIAGSTPAPLFNINDMVDGAYVWTTDGYVAAAVWALVGALALFALDYLAGGFDPE